MAVSANASETGISGVCVGIKGTRVGLEGTPPIGVGVKYCPHNDSFDVQDASKRDATTSEAVPWTKMPMMRFTS